MLKPEQTKLSFWNNQNLFSKNYLEHRLPNTALWKEQKEKVSDVFDVIKKAYEDTKTLKLGPGEEAGLEDKFIRPVLQALGFEWDVQPTTKRGLKKKRPDYALFKDKASLTDARKEKNNLVRFFKHPITILEAKYWGRRLNDADPKDILDKRDPTAQTVKYLDDVYHASESRIQWAILTNGKHWRLFYYKAASRSGNFFEVDLEEIITRDDKEKFLYFYLFFSRDAFIPDSVSGKIWLEQHLKGTEDYAARISTKLKDLIFDKVFEGLAEGFVHYRMSELSATKETDESKKDIFRGCLTLLYRLLFVLYAESRNLLPVNEDAYYRVSLSKLKRDINNDISVTGLDKMSRRSYTYWARLQGLFDIIAKGDAALNVPVYNGGLFETPKDGFLSIHKLPDPFLADATELLTVDHEGIHAPDAPAFIDYSSLSVRHLGDIYEGLLEFHVQIAEGEMAEVKEKGKLLWKKASELKEDKVIGRKQIGDVYIENSKHERKATGSFYTPHFSVEYIVGNTVGPVLDEKLKIADGLLSQFAGMQKKSLNNQLSADSIRGYKAKCRELEDEIFKTVFGIKVLDPAMGSGHFLVHTVDYISDRIIAFLAGYPDNPVIKKIAELRNEILEEISKQGVKIDESKLTEVNLIKRMVMKRCIYGVDLNEMAVELAKLSLWLDSFTLGAPLSFLDHHLKCGNSLVGVMDISDVIIKGTESYSKVRRSLSFMHQVSELTDSTISEAKKSYDLFEHAQQEIEPIRRRFNVVTAKYFTDLGKNISYLEQLAYTMAFDKEPFPENVERCKRALTLAQENHFFHWKLEFPEVFYTDKGEKENPGFDCTVGNPPYIRQEELGNFKTDYLKPNYKVFHGIADIYTYFFERGIDLLETNGKFGMITSNKFIMSNYGEPLRKYLRDNTRLIEIVDFGELPVFTEAATFPAIFIAERIGASFKPVHTRYAPIRTLSFESLESEVAKTVQELGPESFEGKNWVLESSDILKILKKMEKAGIPIEEYCNAKIRFGVKTGFNEAFIIDNETKDRLIKEDSKSSQIIKPLIVGDDVRKYATNYDGKHLILIPKGWTREKSNNASDGWKWFKQHYPAVAEYLLPFKTKAENRYDKGEYWWELRACDYYDEFERPKIIYPDIGMSSRFTIDKEGFYPEATLFEIPVEDYYLLSLLNSELLFYYVKSLTPVLGDKANKGRFRFKTVYLKKLPIPKISFTTPEKERKEFFKEAVKLYERSKYDDVIKWAEYELALKRTDTSHDFLAYLAEQMIELNKAKGNEIKGFVKWLEREIGAEIDTLANKTAIKEYHDNDFSHLLDVLKKNKSRLSIDPSNRKTQELLEKHFNKSMSVLAPLKEKIKTTDELIDEIVYKLYGLSNDEIEVVEERQ